MTARALMLQGTASDVGKSLVAAGLCRALARRGMTVRPFKAQNMSNNAAVTADGGEIGRAQALQALACGVAPSVHMNPVLLKPQSEVGAQLVVQGKVRGNVKARDYHGLKPDLLAAVLESFESLKAEADVVVCEGAGSPAEINLRAGDIANMGFAAAAGVPVVLVADIDRGGVIASLVGTWALLEENERALTRGYVINKFRGDVSLFDDGLAAITDRTGLRSFGVLPHLAAARRLPQEDAHSLDTTPLTANGNGAVKIAVPRLAHIANFDDLDPLAAEPDVNLAMVTPGTPLPGDADLVILPGSKATIADMEDFRRQGWDVDLAAHVRRGGAVMGICGGFQMMGRRIRDANGVEGAPGETAGLGLLDMETELAGDKTLIERAGVTMLDGIAVHGYEMHVGKSAGPACGTPYLDLGGRPDGAVSDDGRLLGCYVHGLFAGDEFRRAFLRRLGARETGTAYGPSVEAALDEVAAAMEEALDVQGLIDAAT